MLYVNTSTELWDPYGGGPKSSIPPTKTLYWRHMNIRRMIAEVEDRRGPTAVIEHGANPGLISHFTKQGLLDIAAAALADKKFKPKQGRADRRAGIADRTFNHLAHAARREGDPLLASATRRSPTSPSRWTSSSTPGASRASARKGTTTAEMGWGTHEKELPTFAFKHKEGPRNQICLARMGMNTWVRSWVPDYTDASAWWCATARRSPSPTT